MKDGMINMSMASAKNAINAVTLMNPRQERKWFVAKGRQSACVAQQSLHFSIRRKKRKWSWPPGSGPGKGRTDPLPLAPSGSAFPGTRDGAYGGRCYPCHCPWCSGNWRCPAPTRFDLSACTASVMEAKRRGDKTVMNIYFWATTIHIKEHP